MVSRLEALIGTIPPGFAGATRRLRGPRKPRTAAPNLIHAFTTWSILQMHSHHYARWAQCFCSMGTHEPHEGLTRWKGKLGRGERREGRGRNGLCDSSGLGRGFVSQAASQREEQRVDLAQVTRQPLVHSFVEPRPVTAHEQPVVDFEKRTPRSINERREIRRCPATVSLCDIRGNRERRTP